MDDISHRGMKTLLGRARIRFGGCVEPFAPDLGDVALLPSCAVRAEYFCLSVRSTGRLCPLHCIPHLGSVLWSFSCF